MRDSYPDTRAAPLDLVPLILQTVSDQKLSLVAVLQGHIDSALLQEALRLVLTHYPILGCQLSTDTKWPTWRRAADTDSLTPITVIETRDDRPLMNESCRYAQDSPAAVAITVLRGPRSDTLRVTVDHTVADAAGAKEVVYTLASFYAQLDRGIRPRPLLLPPPPRDLTEIRARISTFRKLTAVCGWRATPGHWCFPAADARQYDDSVFIVRHLGDQSILRLKAYCKRYAATINDILIAAFFSSLHELHDRAPGERLPIQFTVDLRRYLGPQRHCQVANLSSSTHVWLQKRPENPFGQTLLDTHLALAKVKRNAPGIGAAIILEQIFKLGFPRAKRALEKTLNASLDAGMGNPLFINTGLIDETRLNFGSPEVLSAHMLGPSLLVPGLAMAASGFGGRLSLSVGFHRATTDSEFITRLLKRMICMLPATYQRAPTPYATAQR